MENDRELLEKHFIVRPVGIGIWQVFNKTTKEPASPKYTNIEAAWYYVERELKQEMEDNIHVLLGGE